jgi:hypothetical protein
MEVLAIMENRSENWYAEIDTDMTIYIRIVSKKDPTQIRTQFSRFNTESEAKEWLEEKKKLAMFRDGFFFKLTSPPPPPPPKVKLEEPIVEALLAPNKVETPAEPKQPREPLRRKVRI